MTFRFHDIARLSSVLLAGFALLAAGEAPQFVTSEAPQFSNAVAVTVDGPTSEIGAAPFIRGVADAADDSAAGPAASAELARPVSLRKLVDQIGETTAGPLAGEAKCLATAVFFEARGEPLEGQLGVAQVILNRVASGRYAGSICGVVYQPGQFTFSRRAVNTSSPDWQTAAAISVIARAQRWLQVAPKAMAFHAARMNVSWGGMQRIGRIGNHVFYR